MIKDFNYFDFDIVKFSNEMLCGDLDGLEYINDTIIKNIKKIIKNSGLEYTYYDYIINLYESVRCLNECVFIYEQTKVKNNFKYDLYCETRELLLDALGIEYNFDYNIFQFKVEEEQ